MQQKAAPRTPARPGAPTLRRTLLPPHPPRIPKSSRCLSPAVFTNPGLVSSKVITNQVVGSVAVGQSGNVAVLFTNASANDHLTLVDLKSGADFLSYRTVALKAPVSAAFVAPDDAHAIALLTPASGSSKPGAFSIVPIAKDLPPKIQGTNAPTFTVSIAPAPSTRAVVTTRDDNKKVYATYVARMPELQVDRITLASPPLASGMVPSAGVAFVAQEHPERTDHLRQSGKGGRAHPDRIRTRREGGGLT